MSAGSMRSGMLVAAMQKTLFLAPTPGAGEGEGEGYGEGYGEG